MNKLNTIISSVAVLALVLGFTAYNKTPEVVTQVIDKSALGAVSTPEFYFPAAFYSGVTYSNTLATTSTGAGTLTFNDIRDKTTILSTNAGALTLTLPASTSLSAFIPKPGDFTQMIVLNQGTALLTLSGNTGTLLQTSSSTRTVNIGGSALLNFVRKTNRDIVVNMTPAI